MAPLLSVFDMPTSLKFYREVMGFEVVSDSGGGDHSGWVMLRQSDVTLMLNTAFDTDERPPAQDPAVQAAHRNTCLYFGCEDVDAAYKDLQARGVEADPPQIAHYGMKQLYFSDPDGYSLCYQWPA